MYSPIWSDIHSEDNVTLRTNMLLEMVRILKPGGVILLSPAPTESFMREFAISNGLIVNEAVFRKGTKGHKSNADKEYYAVLSKPSEPNSMLFYDELFPKIETSWNEEELMNNSDGQNNRNSGIRRHRKNALQKPKRNSNR